MQVKTFIAAAAATLAVGTAFAAPVGEYEFNLNRPAPVSSTQSRADVRAEALEAGSSVAVNEYQRNTYAAVVVPSPLQRVQVVAEAKEARRLGLIVNGDRPLPVATPEQLERVHQAGLAALAQRYALR